MSEKPANEFSAPSKGTSAAEDEKALQELRSLLFSEEQHEIVALRERVESVEQRTRDVSGVVAEAIQMRRAQGGTQDLSDALTPTVEVAVRDSVRKDSHVLIEALFPVMGPAIRRAVAEAIRSMVESFNQVLESTFSVRGLKWRMEAIRTGRPYAEVALLHSLIYRVEQVFLIHRKSGLLLQHLVAPAVAIQDPDLVSGMLSAIREFVQDSFNSQQGDSLESLQVGELQIWIEQGPQAILAAVIRGQAPQELRITLKETLEDVHRRFGEELEKFEGDAAPFEAVRKDLAVCAAARYREEKRGKTSPYFWLFAIVVIGLLAGWITYATIENRKWSRFVEKLGGEPGIVITSFGKSDGRYRIQGLRDPLAADPMAVLKDSQLDARDVVFQWGAFYALDDSLVLKRAAALLQPPAGVKLAVSGGVLSVAGDSSAEWARKMRERAPLIAGVRGVDEGNLSDADSLEHRKALLESKLIFFNVGQSEITALEEEHLLEALREIQALVQRAQSGAGNFVVEVLGHADSTGPETTNELLSQERASRVTHALERAGIPVKFLRAKGVGLSSPLRPETDEENRRYNRSVTFLVVPLQSSQGR